MEAIDWGYAISTLVIRFIGVFVVLGILQVFMQVTGRIFVYLDRRAQRRLKPPSSPAEAPTPEEAAAIAMALYLHDRRP